MSTIKNITSHKILDSNGTWTIQTTIYLDSGLSAKASVPSGHSVGKYEAKLVEPDVAIANITQEISPALMGMEITNQNEIDQKLIQLDGTTDKSRLGANSILSVSLAAVNAAASIYQKELFAYLNEYYQFPQPTLEHFPTPLINLINGGAHASNNLEFQSFMISPATYMEYEKSVEMGVSVYHKLKEILLYKNLKIDVGEEGGFAPSGIDIEQTCHFIVEAILESGFKAGTEMFLAIDVAASTFYNAPNYQTRGVLGSISPEQLREIYINLVRNFPILYLEDPYAEDSWDDWSSLNKSIGGSVEIVGDDLTVTNPNRLKQAIEKQSINAIIIKTNQIGTLSEAMEVIKKAQENNLTIVVSHRSGETAEDAFISDLAVAVGANYIKAGAPARGERTVKYNRLLAIEHILKVAQPIPVATILQNNQGGNIMNETLNTSPETVIPTPPDSSALNPQQPAINIAPPAPSASTSPMMATGSVEETSTTEPTPTPASTIPPVVPPVTVQDMTAAQTAVNPIPESVVVSPQPTPINPIAAAETPQTTTPAIPSIEQTNSTPNQPVPPIGPNAPGLPTQ